MKHPLFVFTAKDGKPVLAPLSDIRFRQHLRENEGKEYEIHIRSKKRTNSQNALLWLYLSVISKETGNSENDLHEYFRRKHLPPQFVTVLGKEVKFPHSTTDLNRVEFSDYMERICAETGISIPDTEAWKEYRDSAPLLNE